MKPLIIAVLSLTVLSACTSSLRDDYESGAVTSYAASTLRSSTEDAPIRRADEPSEEMKAAEDHLEAVAREWKERVRRNPADPAALGFSLAEKTPGEEDLKGPVSGDLILSAAYEMSPAIRGARDRLRATVEQFDQIAYLDAILRQYSSFTKDLNLRIGAPRQKEMVEKCFPFPGSMSPPNSNVRCIWSRGTQRTS